MSLDEKTMDIIRDASRRATAADRAPLTAHQMEVIAVAFSGRGTHAHSIALARSTFAIPAPAEEAAG